MDALPRLTDMLLFVFIVRHFFYASIDYRSFACSLKVWRAEATKGCSTSTEKYECKMKYSPEPAEANTILCLEIFQSKGKRIALLRTFSITSKQGFLSGWYRNKLERRVRPGENESQHIGYRILTEND